MARSHRTARGSARGTRASAAWPSVTPMATSLHMLRAIWATSIEITTGGYSSRSTPWARRATVTAAVSMSRTRSAYGLQFGADHLAVVGQGHELGVESGAPGVGVDQPQRPQRVVVGERLAHLAQRDLGTGAQHRQEQIVHRVEVVVDQGRLHPGERGHPPRGRRGIPFVAHDLSGRLHQTLARSGVLVLGASWGRHLSILRSWLQRSIYAHRRLRP